MSLERSACNRTEVGPLQASTMGPVQMSTPSQPPFREARLPKVAIVGLGGSGSYILDLIAKTPICEIHLYDGDTLIRSQRPPRPWRCERRGARQHPLPRGPGEPAALLGDREVHAGSDGHLDPFERRAHLLRTRDSLSSKRPDRELAQMCVNPRNSNVSAGAVRAALDSGPANRPNSITRVFSSASSNANFASLCEVLPGTARRRLGARIRPRSHRRSARGSLALGRGAGATARPIGRTRNAGRRGEQR